LFEQKEKLLIDERRTMMKKLLVLALVCGMASLASAGLNISVNGQDPGPQITLHPSDTIILDVTLDPTTNVMGYDLGVQLEVQGKGTLDGADAQISGFGHTWMAAPAIVTNTASLLRWTAGDVPMFGGLGQTGGKILDNVEFHCDAVGDVLIILYSYASTVNGANVNNSIVDTFLVHQIPEPATMLLLGLGGLFLRKRK